MGTMQPLDTVRIFVKVVQVGSFSKAAEILKIPKSTVSRAIARLEAESGTKLLFRTTRNLRLTAAGLPFYESCVGPIGLLEEAKRSLNGADSILAGNVRITGPEDLGAAVISPVVAKLAQQHPALSFDLTYTDRVLDLVGEGYDLAVRIGRLFPTRFKTRFLGSIHLALVASPAYVKRKGKIRSPEELSSHDCLTYRLAGGAQKWELQSEERRRSVAIHPRLTCNEMSSLVRLAVEGSGIALVPLYLCESALSKNDLIHLLPAWMGETHRVSLVSPLGSTTSARLKLVAEELAKGIQRRLTQG